MKSDSPFYKHCADVLKESVLFSGLDDQSLETMLRAYRRETWPKGANLPPERTQLLFTVVVSGRLELTRINPQTGRSIALFHLSTGDAFDVITLLDGMEHDINPVALEPLEILTAPIGMVRRWIKDNPSFNSAFLPYLVRKIRALEDLSADLALYQTVARLGKLILHEATPDFPLSDEEHKLPNLINTLSDEAMARMIGSVRVVVNRHLQEFIQMGLITTTTGKLVVNDLEKLRDYCERALSR
jgi:CRP/FNR family transcriptional regulator, cyclic AMP receptor protein